MRRIGYVGGAFLAVWLCAAHVPVRGEALYERVEETVTWSGHGLGNPFTDVELKLAISAPSGRKLGSDISFFGFYDGDGNGGQDGDVWKFRILLDAPGDWTVNARFVEPGTDNPKAGAPSEQNFSYNVSSSPVSSGEHGHVRVDNDHVRWFRFDDGTPFYPNPVHASSMFHVPLEGQHPDRTTLPDDMRNFVDEHIGYGINCFGVRWHYEDMHRTFYKDMNTWHVFDLSTFHDYEIGMNYVQSKNLHVYIWFGISGLNTQYTSYGPRPDNNTTLSSEQELFIRYFLARFAAYTCWWHWTTDSEYQEGGSGALERNVTYANYLRSKNPWKTLVSAHSQTGWTPGDNDAFDLATLQSRAVGDNMCQGAEVVEQNYFQRPVFNQEGIWRGHGVDTPDKLRTASWVHFVGGGHSNYAGSDGWGNCQTWDSGMHPTRGTMSKIVDEHLSTPGASFALTEPAHNLVSVSGGDRVWCLAAAGKIYIVWVNQGGNPSLNLSGDQATYAVKRIETKSGSVSTLDNVSGGGEVSLGQTPSTGFGNDFLFVVTSESAVQLAVSTAELPRGAVGVEYSATLSAVNAEGGLTWSIVSGELPAGLALDGNTIEGTPTETGTSEITVEARDSKGTAQKSLSIEIVEADTEPPVISDVGVTDVTAESLTVVWTTDEPSDSRVQWGDAVGNYTGESTVVETDVTEHRVTIREGIPEGTIYLYIITTDTSGNTATLETSHSLASTTLSSTGGGRINSAIHLSRVGRDLLRLRVAGTDFSRAVVAMYAADGSTAFRACTSAGFVDIPAGALGRGMYLIAVSVDGRRFAQSVIIDR